MKANVTTTKTVVPANDVLGQNSRTLYYLIIKTEKGQKIINIGEKTHDEIMKLEQDEVQPKLPLETPEVKPVTRQTNRR